MFKSKSDISETSRFIRKILVFLFPLFVVFELTLGSWFGTKELDSLNIIRNFDTYYDAGNLYAATEKVHYKRDKFGLRGNYTSADKIDILTIGSSVVDQRYISEDETWQNQLQAHFKRNGKSISIANAGLDGYPASQFGVLLDQWISKIPEFKSKYVLLFFNNTELASGFNKDIMRTKKISPFTKLKHNSAAFSYTSALLTTLKTKYFKNEGGHTRVDLNGLAWTDKSNDAALQKTAEYSLVELEGKVNEVVEKLAVMGARPIFVTSPGAYYQVTDGKLIGIENTVDIGPMKLNGVDRYKLNIIINDRLMDLCQRANGICLDLAKDIRFELSDFYDFNHNTPSGSKKIGQYLFEKLRNEI